MRYLFLLLLLSALPLWGTVTIEQWQTRLSTALHHYKNSLQESTAWLNQAPPAQHSFYAQKLIIPNNAHVYFFGDLHGHNDSLEKSLELLKEHSVLTTDNKMINKHDYIVFLGDFVDRGNHGIEVIMNLLDLVIKNPNQVILVRGNHEDCAINAAYGFDKELRNVFGLTDWKKAKKLINRLYDYLPVVLFIGSYDTQGVLHCLQCCHGGLELGFNAYDLLHAPDTQTFQTITTLNRVNHAKYLSPTIKKALLSCCTLKNHTLSLADTALLGYLWHDFMVDSDGIIDTATGRWQYGSAITQEWLSLQSSATVQLHAVLRAHQHYGTMLEMLKKNRGMVPLWDGLVYTFLSVPLVCDFPYHVFGKLSLAPQYADWHLENIVQDL